MIFFCVGKAEFSTGITPVSLVSHDPSEIIPVCWFGAQEDFILLLSQLKIVMIVKERVFFQDFEEQYLIVPL